MEGCNWISAINIRKIVPSKTTTVADPSNPAVFTTRFILAPGGLIDSRSIVGGEVLIIGRNNGEIMNEKKSQPDHINVYGGLVMLMPKGEPYLLRNVGKDDVDLLLVEIRK